MRSMWAKRKYGETVQKYNTDICAVPAKHRGPQITGASIAKTPYFKADVAAKEAESKVLKLHSGR